MRLITNLPTWVRIALLLAVAAVILLVGYLVGGVGLAIILAIGLVVVVLLLLVYRFVLKRLDKRKASPFESQIAANSASAPQGVSDPSRRARLDDLRKQFESGVTKFKSHGKDLYSLPWYLLVGEPGSGKTEAIRHSNVGFPPGLQDELQGAGGTLNMNWWFTNQAVILDTAGRLMFEEVAPGQTSEWEEFLKLLRTSRPNCPVNGMLLVIPADSLISDSSEQIERKGGKIASQLDKIQRSLGVRFPVFVVVTKCDLINGFREYFDDVTDPALQHQMLGWSNPGGLDDPFEPSAIERHLREVEERLLRRRQGMLADPVAKEDPRAPRIGEVDAMFAFPHALKAIGPRLRRYLEMVFVAGEWSNRPLFLRGIYFTSSMREGSVLDAELAEALGVSLQSLPEGRVWEKDRAYFLRDLFTGKVFKERGLVTRSSNAEKMKRRRQMAVLGAGLVTAVLLLLATWITGASFNSSMGEPRAFWGGMSELVTESDPSELSVIYSDPPGSTNYRYRGETEKQVGEVTMQLGSMSGDLVARAATPIRAPLLFKPVATFSADLDNRKADAHRAVLETTVLRPLIDAARRKMSEETGPWSPRATAALMQLVRLETLAKDVTPIDKWTKERELDIEPIALYVLDREEDRALFLRTHAPSIRSAMAFAYEDSSWPPESLAAGVTESKRAVLAGINRFTAHWTAQPPSGEKLEKIEALASSLSRFRDSEGSLLLDLGFERARTRQAYESARDLWRSRLTAVNEAETSLGAAIEDLDSVQLSIDGGPGALVDAGEQEVLGAVRAAYESVRNQLPKTSLGTPAVPGTEIPSASVPLPVDADLKEIIEQLDEGWEAVTQSSERRIEQLASTLGKSSGTYLDRSKAPDISGRLYEVRARMYRLADQSLEAPAETDDLGGVAEAIAGVDNAAGEIRSSMSALMAAGPGVEIFDRARDSTLLAVDSGSSAQRAELLDRLFEVVSVSPTRIGMMVGERAGRYPEPLSPSIPMTELDSDPFNPRYHPRAAGDLFAVWAQASERFDEATRSSLPTEVVERFLRAESSVNAYMRAYVEYWTREVADSAKARQYDDWASFHDDLRGLRVFSVHGATTELLEQMQLALDRLPNALPSGLDRRVALARNANEAELALMVDPRFEDRCKEAVDRWVALGSNAEQARDQLFRESMRIFETRYLSPYSETTGEGASYWNSLMLEAIHVLASGTQNEAAVAYDALVSQGNAYPLNRRDKPELSREDFLRLTRVIDQLSELAGESGQGSQNAMTVGEGATTRYDAINELLARLRADQVISSNRQREWLDSLAGVTEWLSDRSGGLQCEVVILPYAAQIEKSGVDRFRFVELVVNGSAASLPSGRTVANTDAPAPTTGVEFVVGRDTFELRFRTSERGEVSGIAAIESPWGAVRAVTNESAMRLDETPGFEGVWRARVEIREGSGRMTPYWIGLRFNRPVPERRDWPTPDSWPSR